MDVVMETRIMVPPRLEQRTSRFHYKYGDESKNHNPSLTLWVNGDGNKNHGPEPNGEGDLTMLAAGATGHRPA